jgi:hypothetical protein
VVFMFEPVWGPTRGVSTPGRPRAEGAYDPSVDDHDLASDEDPEIPRPHVLEIPFVWFGIQLAEWAIVVSLIVAAVPRTWPTGAVVAVWIVALGVVATVNYAIRRRFIPH